jgi:hypothetical protein
MSTYVTQRLRLAKGERKRLRHITYMSHKTSNVKRLNVISLRHVSHQVYVLHKVQ